MTVYFAQTRADQTTVKIGFTSDLAKRQKNMAVSAPGGIAILATLPGSKETEDYLHLKFSDLRLGGEWFSFEEPIREFIRDIQNGKQGLIPFHDTAIYQLRSTEDFAADAVVRAKQMALEIVNSEFRGIKDTADAARHRVERRYGIKASMLHRLNNRELNDVSASVFLHLQDIHEQIFLRRKPQPEEAREIEETNAIDRSHQASDGGVAQATQGEKRAA